MAFPPAAHAKPMPPPHGAAPAPVPGHPAAPGAAPHPAAAAAQQPPALKSPNETLSETCKALEQACDAFHQAAEAAAQAAEECEDCPAEVESTLRKMADDAAEHAPDIKAACDAADKLVSDEADAMGGVDPHAPAGAVADLDHDGY